MKWHGNTLIIQIPASNYSINLRRFENCAAVFSKTSRIDSLQLLVIGPEITQVSCRRRIRTLAAPNNNKPNYALCKKTFRRIQLALRSSSFSLTHADGGGVQKMRAANEWAVARGLQLREQNTYLELDVELSLQRHQTRILRTFAARRPSGYWRRHQRRICQQATHNKLAKLSIILLIWPQNIYTNWAK